MYGKSDSFPRVNSAKFLLAFIVNTYNHSQIFVARQGQGVGFQLGRTFTINDTALPIPLTGKFNPTSC